MYLKFSTPIAIVVLLLAAFLPPGPSQLPVLQLLVCTAAVLVVFAAIRMERNLWALAFGAIALLFNPLFIPGFSPATQMWLNLAGVTMFVWSLSEVKHFPLMTIASITDSKLQKESL